MLRYALQFRFNWHLVGICGPDPVRNQRTEITLGLRSKRIFAVNEHDETMSNILKRKVKLIHKLTTIEDEGVIAAMERTLEGATHYTLSTEQVRQLDASMERYLSGVGKSYTPEQMRTRALKAIRK